MKYDIPANWRDTCDGQDCTCGNDDFCICEDIDHTTRREYELMLEVNALHAEIARMRVAIREAFEDFRNEAKKPVDGVSGS